MPSLNPFYYTNRHCSLFEIRLENDFIVFRGGENEASSQLLKGVVVLCIKEPTKVEDVHLRLTGQCRITWFDGRYTPSNQKVDRTTFILKNVWNLFTGDADNHHTLAAGNYEWPFELMLPGTTPESVEGLYQTGITYLFKATVTRGKLVKNLHCYKALRIIRTLDPAALELNQAMTVENIWPNKVEYSLAIPQKAVVFGSNVPLDMRFTPLLKGLEIGSVTVKLVEIRELSMGGQGAALRTHKYEYEVVAWPIEVTREKHWQDVIEETEQEGWIVHHELPLPKRLLRCVQDCTVEGIKIRHKLKVNVALTNPDGHVSELRATLPLSIFISPNMLLDDKGNIVAQAPVTDAGTSDNHANMAPPGYGEHVLDQLYEDVDISGIITPGMQSSLNSPFYGQSRAGSTENLAALAQSVAITPAALSSRLLQTMSLDESLESRMHLPHDTTTPGTRTPHLTTRDLEHITADSSLSHSPELSRRTSEDGHPGHSDHQASPTHAEFPSMAALSRVPSYATATKTHAPRVTSYIGPLVVPDYNTATGAPVSPGSPTQNPAASSTEDITPEDIGSEAARSRSAPGTGRGHFHGFSFLPGHAAMRGGLTRSSATRTVS
ncbi:arrestin domain-containing protein [Xylaria sp. CBS 124048]|nr:arrestin domain-containing protein [Xylaria sp. CBS 124048]